MVDFSKKRLQVFISSTYLDLIEERQAAVQAILHQHHIPAGMELFTSGDQSQLETIKEWIDASDVFLLILGGRYGTIEPISGDSYVHVEYEYARSVGKPFFACVISEKGLDVKVLSQGRKVLESEQGAKLSNFRKRVTESMCAFWDDVKDLKLHIIDTLSRYSMRSELNGWVRASEQSDIIRISNEVARLSRENSDLRSKILSAEEAFRISGLTFAEMYKLLEKQSLLHFFTNQSCLSQLAKGLKHDPSVDAQLSRLSALGLLEFVTENRAYSGALQSVQYVTFSYFRLSPAGRAFAARISFNNSIQT